MTNIESWFIIRKQFVSANFNCSAIEQCGSTKSAMIVVAKWPATGMLHDCNIFVDVASCSHQLEWEALAMRLIHVLFCVLSWSIFAARELYLRSEGSSSFP